jgi:hypothetical protein
LKLGAVLCGFEDGYYRNGGQSTNKIPRFLWFNDNAEDAAEFYAAMMKMVRFDIVTPIPTSDIAAAIAEIIEAAMFKHVFCPDRRPSSRKVSGLAGSPQR